VIKVVSAVVEIERCHRMLKSSGLLHFLKHCAAVTVRGGEAAFFGSRILSPRDEGEGILGIFFHCSRTFFLSGSSESEAPFDSAAWRLVAQSTLSLRPLTAAPTVRDRQSIAQCPPDQPAASDVAQKDEMPKEQQHSHQLRHQLCQTLR
jgi:hypothetical protein